MSSALQMVPMAMRQGVWEGRILQNDTGVPQVEVLFQENPVEAAKLTATDDPTTWALTVPIPSDAISDGVQTFLIVDKLAKEKIGHFTLLAGEALGDDVRAEVDLLRAELDMLKRAFRRHCLETS